MWTALNSASAAAAWQQAILQAELLAVSELCTAPALQAYVYLSLQLLVTACPCALILSTPVTVCRCAPSSAAAAAVSAVVLAHAAAVAAPRLRCSCQVSLWTRFLLSHTAGVHDEVHSGGISRHDTMLLPTLC